MSSQGEYLFIAELYSIYYLNYQAAELLFCIPMNSMGGMTTEDMINGNDKSNFSYQIKEDSMQINYSQINAIDGKITDLNYLWNKVFSYAIDHTWPLKRIWPSFSMGRGFGDQYPRCRFKYNESEDSSIIKKLELLKTLFRSGKLSKDQIYDLHSSILFFENENALEWQKSV